MNMLTIVGIISIVISGFLVGSWTNGDRQRANFNSENEHERKQKKKWAWRCFLYGIVMIAISAGINLIF